MRASSSATVGRPPSEATSFGLTEASHAAVRADACASWRTCMYLPSRLINRNMGTMTMQAIAISVRLWPRCRDFQGRCMPMSFSGQLDAAIRALAGTANVDASAALPTVKLSVCTDQPKPADGGVACSTMALSEVMPSPSSALMPAREKPHLLPPVHTQYWSPLGAVQLSHPWPCTWLWPPRFHPVA